MVHEAGRELDRLIAERVFDLTVRQGIWFDEVLHTDGGSHPVRHYSTEIAEAWRIVEQIGGYFLLQHVGRTGRFGFEPITWYCAFAAPRRFEVTADTASLAICLAALEYVEGKDDTRL